MPLNIRELYHFFLLQFQSINSLGLDFFNDYFPSYYNYSEDKFSEWIKGILYAVIIFSSLMMFTYPLGWMYACFPRPFTMIFHFIWDNYTPLVETFTAPIPEWGLHYTTIFTYALFALRGIEAFEKQGIRKPIHKLCYIFVLTIITFFVPFELFYITLYDIFHSIPKFGYPAIWTFGYWKPFPENLLQSVFMYDVILPFLCFLVLRYLYRDLKDYYDLKFKMNKKSLILFVAFIFSMLMWVTIPLHTEVEGWGTKWFPQTTYVDYGNYTELGIDWGKGEFGIVAEYWYPNDMIKMHNIVAKFISVWFMFYTFIPVKKNGISC